MAPLEGRRKSISAQTPEKLEATLKGLGQPAFRAKQLFSWLHQKGADSFEAMTNLPAPLREALGRQFYIEKLAIVRRLASAEDGTVKLLLELRDGNLVETVLMRYKHGATVCVSCQAGCRMGCRFCASTAGGLVRSLDAGEILAQVDAAAAENGGRVDNVVLMGIGEPLDNFDSVMDFYTLVTHPAGRNLSGRGISLSTCGVVPGIDRLAEQKLSLTLSISLHAANNPLRTTLMPVNKRWPLEELMAACRRYRKITGRRISFEYTMLAGVNDRPADAEALAALVAGTDTHINLIPANVIEGSPYLPTNRTEIDRFAALLAQKGVRATVRRRLGNDIDAACGQLRMQRGQPTKS